MKLIIKTRNFIKLRNGRRHLLDPENKLFGRLMNSVHICTVSTFIKSFFFLYYLFIYIIYKFYSNLIYVYKISF